MSILRKRSNINLSRNSKLTCHAGRLIPFMCEKVLPNDVIGGKTDLIIRVAPQIAPVLDNMKVKMYYFYCPTRLLNPKGEEVYEEWFSNQGCKYVNFESYANDKSNIYTQWTAGSLKNVTPMGENGTRDVFQHFFSDNIKMPDQSEQLGMFLEVKDGIDNDFRTYGILGTDTSKLTSEGTVGIPIAYPHFDTTLPKFFAFAGSTESNKSISTYENLWMTSVPYVGGIMPYFTECGSLADYFGVAIGPGKWGDKFNIFPFLMYRKVFNEFFRDPLKRDPLPETLHDYGDCFGSLRYRDASNISKVGSTTERTSGNFPLYYNKLSLALGNEFSFGIFGFEPNKLIGTDIPFGVNGEHVGLQIYSQNHYRDCYPLLDPACLSNFARYYSGIVSDVGDITDTEYPQVETIEVAPLADKEQRVIVNTTHLLPFYTPSDLKTGENTFFIDLKPLIYRSDSSGSLLTQIGDDSQLGDIGLKLAENYSIFNDLLYKPAKRNIWNTCICDPSYLGQKFVVPTDRTGVNFDFDFGGNTQVNATGLDLRELKVYSRIGLFYNFLAWTGDKYEDQMYMIYGVAPADLRMKHPKFIGSSESNIIFSEVINTAGGSKSSDYQAKQGTATGYAFGSARRRGFSYHAKEEGYVLGLLCIEPRGRDYSRRPRALDIPKSYFDIPNPFFDGIGDTEVKIGDFVTGVFNGMHYPNGSPENEETSVISGLFDVDKGHYLNTSNLKNKVLRDAAFKAMFLGNESYWRAIGSQLPGMINSSSNQLEIRNKPCYTSAFMCHEFVDNLTFGYQKQYFEYRNSVPELHGEYLLSKRHSHLTRFFNEFVPDINLNKVYTNVNNAFGEDRMVGLSSFATDMLALDTYRYNSVHRLFDIQDTSHPFWIDLDIDVGVSRIIGNGGISLV